MERSSEAARGVALSAASAVLLAGLFAPWLRSGASRRSSFEMLDLVERLGFAPGGAVGWGVRLWPVVPLLVVVAVVAHWWGRPVPSAVAAGVAGVYTVTVAVAVRWAPSADLIRPDWGVLFSALAGLVVFACGCWIAAGSAVSRARSREP